MSGWQSRDPAQVGITSAGGNVTSIDFVDAAGEVWTVTVGTDGQLQVAGEADHSGTVTQQLAAATQALSGTFVAPPGVSTITQVLAAVEQAATGTHVAPTFAGTAAQTLPAVTQSAGGFDPLSIGWHTVFYADDLTLDDGDPVGTWPDSSGNSRDATQATAANQPAYRSAHTPLGGQPAVEAADGDFMKTAAFTALTQPNTIVAVCVLPATTATTLHDGIASGNRNLHYGVAQGGDDPRYSLFAGSANARSPVATDNTKRLVVSEYNGSSSRIILDGTAYSPGDPGSHSLTGLTVFSYFDGSNAKGLTIAFLGLADGLLTSTQLSDLHGWAQGKYGTA